MIIPEIDKEILLDKDTAYVYNVRTAKKYRGKGISSYAYSLIAGHLRDSGYKHLRVVVAKSNIASIKSIEKAGFKKRQQITYYRLLSVFKKYYVKNY